MEIKGLVEPLAVKKATPLVPLVQVSDMPLDNQIMWWSGYLPETSYFFIMAVTVLLHNRCEPAS